MLFSLILLDTNFNTCDALQEAFDSQDSEYDVIYTSFPEGSIVWAKLAGYPWYVLVI